MAANQDSRPAFDAPKIYNQISEESHDEQTDQKVDRIGTVDFVAELQKDDDPHIGTKKLGKEFNIDLEPV